MKRDLKEPLRTSAVRRVRWRGRKALRLSNGVIEVLTLEGGGHIAEFRFAQGSGRPATNVLWECPWEGASPSSAKANTLAMKYGGKGIGEFLVGFTGHGLCLDYFGAASAEESRLGLPLHGEAGCLNWRSVKGAPGSSRTKLKLKVELPIAGLGFSREIGIRKKESVVWIREDVANRAIADHYFHWVQHVTLGAPFMDPACSRVFLSGNRAKTWPLGYEKKSLVAAGREFHWPHAPRERGGKADLSIPFREPGTGFVASVLLDRERKLQFVAALNWKLGLASGYVFRREDFQWVAVWEENCARNYVPWSGTSQARGMEFGTTPMPIGKEATFISGKLFDTVGWAKLPALATRTARYAAFLAEVPKTWRGIRDVEAGKDALILKGTGYSERITIAASGISGWYA